MKFIKYLPVAIVLVFFVSCKPKTKSMQVPVVGFVDAFEDATISQARKGFTDALNKNGFSEEKRRCKLNTAMPRAISQRLRKSLTTLLLIV
ncbi:hypothetical protein ACRQ5D_28245 [Mucilaginibacter sp. P25]|uniref:hypothetical protein n=1 Tax=unclassified Mucilaginibacter TaxID=2617802 RepID=UPI003D66DD2C